MSQKPDAEPVDTSWVTQEPPKLVSGIRHSIILGPGHTEFTNCLTDSYPLRDHQRRLVTFSLPNFIHCKVAIYGLEQVADDGIAWRFKGIEDFYRKRRQVHGYYDTRTRAGWIEFDE